MNTTKNFDDPSQIRYSNLLLNKFGGIMSNNQPKVNAPYCATFSLPVSATDSSNQGLNGNSSFFETNLLESLDYKSVEYFPKPIMAGRGWSGQISLFFQGLHRAFHRHIPFAFSAELLAFLIQHEIALTISLHPEDYKGLFTRHVPKIVTPNLIRRPKDLTAVQIDDSALLQILKQLSGSFSPETQSLLFPSFSTTNLHSKAAFIGNHVGRKLVPKGEEWQANCGIPEIRLLGNPTDYVKLFIHCLDLRKNFAKHLDHYFKELLPVLEKICKQVLGEAVDNEFWSGIYQYGSDSESQKFSGWTKHFLAYSHNADNLTRISETQNKEIALGQLPTHISEYRFKTSEGKKVFELGLVTGIMSIENVDGFLTPGLSYAVLGY